MNQFIKTSIVALVIIASCAQEGISQSKEDVIGRWDLTVEKDGQQLPSWLEVTKSGANTLIGRFVYAFGSARPVSEVKYKDGSYSFAIPKQWEGGKMDMSFEFHIKGEKLSGTMQYVDGSMHSWRGVRAPAYTYNANVEWGAPIQLYNGKDLSNWNVKGNSEWVVENGLLRNIKSGGNLVSNEEFRDFKLHVEFRYPAGSNSGIYLRGRHEVQIEDNYGREPDSHLFAGVYGFLTPNEMAAKKPGEWQEYDITLVGSRVSIVANGKEVITNQNIPGITGGALDSNESEPGPLFIQGDHGPIDFRKIVITPAK